MTEQRQPHVTCTTPRETRCAGCAVELIVSGKPARAVVDIVDGKPRIRYFCDDCYAKLPA